MPTVKLSIAIFPSYGVCRKVCIAYQTWVGKFHIKNTVYKSLLLFVILDAYKERRVKAIFTHVTFQKFIINKCAQHSNILVDKIMKLNVTIFQVNVSIVTIYTHMAVISIYSGIWLSIFGCYLLCSKYLKKFFFHVRM